MRGAEVEAIGELAGRALSGTGALLSDVHAAIARRAFDAAGPSGASARAIHDGVAAAVYGGVRVALEAVPRGTAAAVATKAGEDWCDCDPDELLTDRCHDVPFLPDATFYFIAATVSRGGGDPLGAVVGDLLVRVPSASGAGRRRRIRFGDGRQLGGLTHFDLLNHPAVYEQIRAWLAR